MAGNTMRINLVSLGDIAQDIMSQLKTRTSQVFGCPMNIEPTIAVPEHAYNAERNQYLATDLISLLDEKKGEDDDLVIGITEVDLYAPRFSFVFGQADTLSHTAVISLCRLRQEYYGLPHDEALCLERATKEIVHELGHTFGLGHCPNSRCIMHFSNSLADTDYKEAIFCAKCQPELQL
jgi:archaemetzincin